MKNRRSLRRVQLYMKVERSRGRADLKRIYWKKKQERLNIKEMKVSANITKFLIRFKILCQLGRMRDEIIGNSNFL